MLFIYMPACNVLRPSGIARGIRPSDDGLLLNFRILNSIRAQEHIARIAEMSGPVSSLESSQASAAVETLRAAASAAADGEESGAQAQGWLAILELKSRNRELYLGLEQRRQLTAEAKAELEKTHLQLQNLLYEKAHYANEIQTCREFRSAWSEEEVGLLAEEEFARLPSAAESAGPADAHSLMLSRLAFELSERKKLAEDLQELKLQRKACLERITSQRVRGSDVLWLAAALRASRLSAHLLCSQEVLLAMSTELGSLQAAGLKLGALCSSTDRALLPQLPVELRNLFGSLEKAGGLGTRFTLSIRGAPAAAEEGRLARGQREDEPSEEAEGLSVVLELQEGESALRVRFDHAPAAAGGLSMRAELGDPRVLEKAGAAEDGLVPSWLRRLGEGVDDAIAGGDAIDALAAAARAVEASAAMAVDE